MRPPAGPGGSALARWDGVPPHAPLMPRLARPAFTRSLGRIVRALAPLGVVACGVLAAAGVAAAQQAPPVGTRAPATLPAVGSAVAGRVLAWPDSLPIAGAMVTVEALGRSVLASRD